MAYRTLKSRLTRKILFLLLIISFSASGQQKNLEYYVNAATKNSPLLNDYRNRIISAKIDSSLLKASYKTHVTANSSGTYAPVIHGYGYDYALSNGQSLNAFVTASRNLTGSARLKTELQSIRLAADSLRSASAIGSADLIRTITAQYITSFADQQQVDFNRQLRDLLLQEEVILKRLTRSSVYKQSDYLSFYVTLQQQETALDQAVLRFKNDFAVLNYLAGVEDTTATLLQQPELMSQAARPSETSIFYKQFRVDSLLIRNSKRLVDLSYRPKAGVYADAGYSSSFQPGAYRNFGTSAGFTLAFPIYDGGQRKLQYKKLDIAEQTRLFNLNFFARQHRQEIARLTQQIHETQKLYEKIAAQINYSKTLIEVNRKLLMTGDARIADIVIAINTYMNAQNALRETNIDRLQLISELNYWNK